MIIKKLPSLLLLLLLLSQAQSLVSRSIGFSFKLVYLNKKYLQKATNNISDNKQTVFPDAIRPHITYSDNAVAIDASIGTPSHRKTFIFDTASSLTWTQCRPCKNCFNQTLPLFDPTKSTSYQKMDGSHPFSDSFNESPDGSFVYIVKYLFQPNRTSKGIVSIDTFSFPSNCNGSSKSIGHIVFGCANNNLGDWPNDTPITGIMGMDRSPLSLIPQIGVRSVRRFSYCFPTLSSSIKTTFLRFGTHVKKRSNLLNTKLTSGTEKYVINLQGVSIAGSHLNPPKGTFPHGCIIHTASSHSRLETRTFAEVVKTLTRRFKLTKLNGPDYKGRLCYPMRQGFNSFPNMTLHFNGTGLSRGADYQITRENLFVRLGDVFCMTVSEQPNLTILGAFQMQNVRFIIDVVGSKVSFGAEDCSKDRT